VTLPLLDVDFTDASAELATPWKGWKRLAFIVGSSAPQWPAGSGPGMGKGDTLDQRSTALGQAEDERDPFNTFPREIVTDSLPSLLRCTRWFSSMVVWMVKQSMWLRRLAPSRAAYRVAVLMTTTRQVTHDKSSGISEVSKP
jgi:hypothetical protein